jgi:GDSL-like Lipase/Acylhydrolase family
MIKSLTGAFAATRRCLLGVALLVALGLAGCGGEESSAEPDVESAADTSAASSGEAEGLTYLALGDSWIQGAHCNGCRTFPQTHAEALSELLGKPVTFQNLAGDNQPYFETPGGGGSTGLRKALQMDEVFRERVAGGDIIVISTGPNDLGRIGKAIENGTCGGADDTACVAELDRRWHRDFDAILSEIEELRAGQPTAIRLVSVPNEFNDPSFSPATLRGFEASFEALAQAMCDNAKKHDVVCIDTRPVLNGPDFEQPVAVDAQESMDAVAELLAQTGIPELEE